MSRLAFEAPLRSLRAELVWLSVEFRRTAQSASSRQAQLACEMAVIRMHDAWARFCRELVINSALGNTRTTGGMLLVRSRPDILDRGSVIPVLLSSLRSRWEPKWAHAAASINAGRALNIQNIANVAAALGASNSPAEPVRKIRNFYAHRGKDTSNYALSTGLFTGPQPRVFELNNFTTGGVTVIETWVREFDAVAVAAMQ